LTFRGDEYSVSVVIDDFTPGMEKIYCISPTKRLHNAAYYKFESLCLVDVG
jgi:hypothetical protein